MTKVKILEHPVHKKGALLEVDDLRAKAWIDDGIAELADKKKGAK